MDRHLTSSVNMFRLIVLFVAVAVQSQSTSVSQCRHNAGELPINTHIEGCTTPPCVLPQLQDAVIQTTFRAPRAIKTMRTLATAYLRIGVINLPIPYPLEEKAHTCDFLTNASCPVQEGQIVKYNLNMFIESFFPVGVQASIEFRVEDEFNSPVFCINVPIVIGPPEAGTV